MSYNNNNYRDSGGGGGDRRSNYGDNDRRSDSRDNRDRRGGYESDRRGGYESDRRGGYDSGRRGGYDSDRRGGGYDSDRRGGGYDSGRRGGGYDSEQRSDSRNYDRGDRYGGGGGDRRYDDGRRGGYSDRGRSDSRTRPYDRGGGGGGYRGGRGGGRGGGGGRDFTEVDSRDVKDFQVVKPEELPAQIPILKETKVQLNAFALDLSRAVPVYMYDFAIIGIKKRGGEMELTRHSSSDATRNMKFDCLEDIFQNLLEKNSVAFKRDEEGVFFVYDRSKLLFSSANLLGDDEERSFAYPVAELKMSETGYIRKYSEIRISMKRVAYIQPATFAHEQDKNVRTQIQQYIDLLTTQHAMKSKEFFTFGAKMYRKASTIDLRDENKVVLKEGIQKNTKVIENERGDGFEMLVQIDAKRSAFYRNFNVVDFLLCDFRRDDLRDPGKFYQVLKKIKNLCVETRHLNYAKRFVVRDISPRSADGMEFEIDGKKTNVTTYFRDHYGINLEFPQFPCLMESTSKHCAAFPMELLWISDGQRMSMAEVQRTFGLNEKIIRACQQKPLDLVANIKKESECLELNNSNEILKDAKVRVNRSGRFVEANAKELIKPSITYQLKQLNLKGATWKCEDQLFLQPAKIEKLAVIGETYGNKLADYQHIFVSTANRFGIQIDKVEVVNLRGDNREDLLRLCDDLIHDGFTFLLFASDSKNLHGNIKHLEIEKRVPTQQIKTKNLKPGDTLKNILMKTNLKAGGRNHTISTDPTLAVQVGKNGVDILRSMLEDTLVVGVEMSLPVNKFKCDGDMKQQEPVVVGIASTVDRNANVVNGTYFFQQEAKTIVKGEALGQEIWEAMKIYNVKSGKYPKRVIIYRSGISEGQFFDVKEEECDRMKSHLAGCCDQNRVQLPNLIVIACTKKNNHRVFQSNNEMETRRDTDPAFLQNVAAGTIITGRGTNPIFKEFLMVPQKALLGTCKALVGTVIFEYPLDIANIDHIGNLTHALCYMHEVSTGSISVPAPLRSAEQLAQRGKNNWVQYKILKGDDASSIASNPAAGTYTEDQKEEFLRQFQDYCESLTNDLKTKLPTKFWA